MNDAVTPGGQRLRSGTQTMSGALPEAVRYHRYLYDRLSGALGRRVWEIGAGHGQYTDLLLEDGREVLASDVDTEMVAGLQARRHGYRERLSVAQVDLRDERSITDCASWLPDSVLCLNVLEHIPEDERAVGWLHRHLPAGCRAVFLTPALPALYGFMDSEAGHVRRYTRKSLAGVFSRAGWAIEKDFYMNPVGGLGWFFRNRIAPPSARELDSPRVNDDIRFFDRYLVPLTRALDPLFAPVFGQSVVVVARR